MNVRDLAPFVAPPPPPIEVCAGCKTFRPDCLLPRNGGAIGLCWVCAHHVVVHASAVEHAHVQTCECTPDAIYARL